MQDKSSRREVSDKLLSRRTSPPVRFAGLVLELDACTLARNSGETIALTRGEFALLRMFAARPGRVMSRDAFCWTPSPTGGLSRTTAASTCMSANCGERSRPIRKTRIVTVPGEGYRFDGLRFRPPESAKLADADSASKRKGRRPRLSIVVLPFVDLGGDPEQKYFADGVTESLTTDLSRVSGALVIGRSTAFTYSGKAVDLKQIGRELNVRYVLEGSVQRGGHRLRVNVQLIDAETSNHLWAERFDKPLADLFDMQDEIVSRLANRLGHELARAEARRAGRSVTPDSVDHYFLGLADLNKGQTTDLLDKARFHFDRALDLDPDNVDALVGRCQGSIWALSLIGCPRTAPTNSVPPARRGQGAQTEAGQRDRPSLFLRDGSAEQPRRPRHRRVRTGAGD